jgi:hypothetical protein
MRFNPEMRAKELAHEDELAGSGENEIKESRLGPLPLAGTEGVTKRMHRERRFHQFALN